ncbi:MAG: hypothetical protein RR334_03850 [Clostridia bacterium]
MSVTEIISIAVNVLQIIAFFALFRSYYTATRNDKVQYFFSQNRLLYSDDRLCKGLFLAENNKIPDNFEENEELCKTIVASLAFFNSICYMHRTKKIKTYEYVYFCTEMHNLVCNAQVQKYLDKILKKVIAEYIGTNKFALMDIKKIDFVDEFLPYLSLQLYVYMEDTGCKFNKAHAHFDGICHTAYSNLINQSV